MDATAGSSRSYGKPAMVEKPRPDFLIKYEPASGPAALEWTEEPVMGGQEEAARRVRDLIATGQTTPTRVWIYANTGAAIDTVVNFDPKAH